MICKQKPYPPLVGPTIYSLSQPDNQGIVTTGGDVPFLILFNSQMDAELFAASRGYKDVIPRLMAIRHLLKMIVFGEFNRMGLAGVATLGPNGNLKLISTSEVLQMEQS